MTGRPIEYAIMLAGLGILVGAWRVQGQQFPETLRVGAIDFFGAQGMDTAPILKDLSIHSGQMLSVKTMEQTIARVRADARTTTGMTLTNVEVVCCDTPDTVDFYIGLPGQSYKAQNYVAAPTGDAHLPPHMVSLYKQDLDLLLESIQHGVAGEDDSNGYSLSKYPAAKRVQLAMRTYAVANATEIERVLREAKNPEQRRASATLLGYSERSAGQVAALAEAANDDDSEVRNNATRALEVMLAAGPLKDLDAAPFVRLLYSGSWSDRNKASLMLDRMTETRDAVLLRSLRGALGPLIDGAQWHSAGHAEPFLAIPGRMGEIDAKTLQRLIDTGAKDEIIAAAAKL